MAPAPTKLPLRPGSAAQFARLREMLQQANFDEASLCARTGIKSISRFESLRDGRAETPLTDMLDVLIRLFMDGEVLDREAISGLIPTDALPLWQDLGLAASIDGQPGRIYASMYLYPVQGIYIVSDRTRSVDGQPSTPPADVVYAAITENTTRFVNSLPNTPCEALLDIGTGSGVAALAGARHYAKHAWGCDITARSVYCAEFNRLLNGIENATLLQSDLYAAVADLTFDRIVAHPPYVPNLKTEMVFRDGGEDGEQILRAIVQGLPRHLRQGGEFYAVSQATDRKDETLEQRLRKWLGDAAAEFDVFLIGIDQQTEAGKPPTKEGLELFLRRSWQLHETYYKLQVTGVFYGTIVLRRRTAEDRRAPINARAMRADGTGYPVVDWVMRWHEAVREPHFLERLQQARPRCSANLELEVTHRLVDGDLIPAAYRLKTSQPLVLSAGCDPAVAVVIASCRGEKTIQQIWEEMRDQQVINEQMTARRFTQLMAYIMSGGLLEIDEFALPVVPSEMSNRNRTA